MTGLSGNGQTSGTGSNCYYYDVASGTGSSDTLNAPNSFELLVVSSQNAQGEPVVDFEYKDPTMSAFYTYDPVTFTDFKHVSLDRGFFVDGLDMNPIGLFEDAELTIGGPGGGSYTITKATTVAFTYLYFWNGNNFQAVRSAWNLGSDTAESTSYDISRFANDGSGTPWTVQLNSTTHAGTPPAQAYTEAQVGTLAVSASTAPTGKIVVAAMPCTDASPLTCTDNYQGGQATLTLYPGTYHVWDNTSSNAYDLGMCTITAGSTLSVTVPTACSGTSGPTISSFTATPNPVASGSATTLSVTASGGTGTLSYAYSGLPPGCATANTASLACTPTSPGVYSVNATVNDSGTGHAHKLLSLTVTSSTPLSATFTASPNPVSLNSSVTFTVAATGGTPSYTYAYSGLPPGCTSSNVATFACTPSAAGTYNVNATVNDTAGGHIYRLVALVVSAIPPPSISLFDVQPNPVTAGAMISLTVTVTGGAAPLSFVYTGLPPGCTTQNASSFTCNPTAAGSYTITVTVTDASMNTATKTATLTVVAPVAVSTFTATPPSFYLGTATTLAVITSGGQTPFTYAYSGLPAGCATTNSSSFGCTPTMSGAFTIKVTVTDNLLSTATSTTSLDVYAGVSIGAFDANVTTAYMNSPTTFTVYNSAGGVTPYTFSYSGLPTGCTSSNTSTLPCTPTAAGSYTVTVTVTDVNGHSATKTAALTVVALPTITSFAVSPPTVVDYSSTTLTVVAAGGTAPYTYSYTGLPNGCASQSKDTFQCTPSVVGNFTVKVTVKDAGGKSVSATATLEVTSLPSPTISSFVAVPSSFTVGTSTVLTVTASGGTGPLTYSYSGLPDGCTSMNASALSCTPTSTGSYTIMVTVTDVHQMSTSASVTIQVNSQSTSGGLLGNNLWLLVILVVIVAAVIVVILVARRGKKPAQMPAAESQAPPYDSNNPMTNYMDPSQAPPVAPQDAFGPMPPAGELPPPGS
jgi:hypothetical protein